ncbi:MAG: hypothetical protein GY834_09945 [Bacteroidetes bacterium]|nr:hypothetical protein [Bacteroidota bacterium]
MSNPTVEVNDIVIAILPNSLSYRLGKGNKNVRSQSSGGEAIDVIITEDATTKVSMCKFSLITTIENTDAFNSWVTKSDYNTITLSQGSYNVAFSKMAVITEPDTVTGADGVIEIEFQGKPVS